MPSDLVKQYPEYCEYQYRREFEPRYKWHRAYLTERAFRKDHPNAPLVKITCFDTIKEGDWVHCSNGWIVQCFSVKSYKKYGRPFLNMYVGGRRVQGHTKTKSEKYFEWYPRTKAIDHIYKLSARKRFFCELMLNGMDPLEAHKLAFKKEWQKSGNLGSKHYHDQLMHEALPFTIIKLRAEKDMSFREKLTENKLNVDSVVQYMTEVMNNPDAPHAAKKWACDMILKFEKKEELGAASNIDSPMIDQEAIKQELEKKQAKVIQMASGQ